MLRKFIPYFTAIFSLAFLVTSCNKKNEEGRYVPANAGLVVHVNMAALQEKLPWAEIKSSGIFAEMSKDSSMPAFAAAAWDNPENTGVDINKDLLIFYVKDTVATYAAVEGSIKDAEKFKLYNSSALKTATPSQKDGISFLSNDTVTVSWNKDRFILVTNVPITDKAGMQSWMDAMENRIDGDSTAIPALPMARFDGVSIATSLYNLTEKNSLAENEKFTDLVKTSGDLHFWMNTEALYGQMPEMAGLAMLNLEKIYKSSVTAGTVKFEKGQMLVDTKSYAGKEMTELWKKYSGKSVNEAMLKNIPGKDIAVLFAMNFKPEGIREFLKLLGMEGFANMGAGMLGFSVDDFVKANKGDLLFSVYDVSLDSNQKPAGGFLFSTSVGDKAAFEKLMAAGKKMGSQALQGNKLNFKTDGKLFAIGNEAANVDVYMAGTSKPDLSFTSKWNGAPMGGYVNIQYLLTAMAPAAKQDTAVAEIVKASQAMWKNATFSGGDMKGDAMTQHIEVNLMNQDVNSLKQLNEYMGNIIQWAKKKQYQKPVTSISIKDSAVADRPNQM